VRVLVPAASYPECRLANRARIMKPQAGILQNQQANKIGHAALDFSPLKVGDKTYCGAQEPAAQVCPPGFRWTGDRCSRGPGLLTPPAARMVSGSTRAIAAPWARSGRAGVVASLRSESARKERSASGPTAARSTSPSGARKV
jgi:hypothetical protein